MRTSQLIASVVVTALIITTFMVTFINYYEECDYYFALGLSVSPHSYSACFFEGGNRILVGKEFMDDYSQRAYDVILWSFKNVYVKVYRIRNGELESFAVSLRAPWFRYELRAKLLEAVMFYLSSLEKYLQTFKDDEFLIEVYLLCINAGRIGEILERNSISSEDYFKVLVEVLYVGKGGEMIAFATTPFNVLLKFRARTIPPPLIFCRVYLASFLPLFLFIPLLLIVNGCKGSGKETKLLKLNLILMLVLLLAHTCLVMSLVRKHYEALRRVNTVSIHRTLAPLGFTKTLELVLSEGNVSIRLKDVVSDYELQALRRVCSYFKKKNVMIVVTTYLEELVKVHYLNASIAETSNGVLVPLEELDGLVIKLSISKLKNFKTYIYIAIGVPTEVYKIDVPPQITFLKRW